MTPDFDKKTDGCHAEEENGLIAENVGSTEINAENRAETRKITDDNDVCGKVMNDDGSPFVCDLETGLSSEQAAKLTSDGKLNGEQTIRTKSYAQIFASNIFTFFNLVFTVLALILVNFIEWDAAGIGNFGFIILVIFNCGAGIVQEVNAKRTIDKLALLSAPKVKVIRDGEEQEVQIEKVLLNDLISLTAGDQICADATLVSGSIEVNESMITGEPDAIEKKEGDELTSGSYVVSGKAKAVVRHIGMDNFVMKISAGAKYFKKPNSEIMRSLMFFVKVMTMFILPLGIALFCVKFFAHDNNLNDTVITTIATLIGMIPSGLIALATTVFCISVIRLSKHKAFAQDMYCVETLARVDVLCLDKTGTITEASMEVNSVQAADGKDEDEFRQLLKKLVYATGDENSTASAIKNYVGENDLSYVTGDIVPFSSSRKWSGANIDGVSYVMGAPEFIFPDRSNEKLNAVADDMAEQGYRVLVAASSPQPFDGNSLPDGLTPEGMIFITDKIRPEAPDTLRFFDEQGVKVKIISGDNPQTVRAVAKRAGLKDYDNYIDMSTLSSDEEVRDAAEKYTIFGRVLPDQKLMLIKALKANRHTVAMTGDGVNDVLALKEADCSVAMNSGSDAAKNVSSLVLLDSNFSSMPKVVAEGRRSINNMERSASLFLVKTLYSLLFALMFMIAQSDLPFAPRHLTLIAGLTIGIPSFVLALEPNDKRVTGRFLPKVLAAAVPGAITVALGVAAVLICHRFFLPDMSVDQLQYTYLVVTMVVGFMYLFKVCLPFNLIHAVLFLSMLGLFFAAIFVPIPFIREFFGISEPITGQAAEAVAVICVIMAVVFVVLLKLTKPLGDKMQNFFEEKHFSLDKDAKLRFGKRNKNK